MLDLIDYIVTLPGILPEPVCKDIIAEYGEDVCVGRAVTTEGVHPSRTCSQLLISQPVHCNQNLRRRNIDKALTIAVQSGMNAYRARFPVTRLKTDTGHLYVRYKTGEFYKQHTDSHMGGEPRLVTMSIALNDDYTGGAWCWFDRELVKNFQTGTAVLFPSNWMYPHEIAEVTKGTRHAVLTWYKA